MKSLAIVLSAILALNVIAILLLSGGSDDRPPADVSTEETSPPVVRTLVLEDRDACPDCFNVSLYLAELQDVIDLEIVHASPEGFGLPRQPALAFNASIESYPASYLDGWESFGYTVVRDEEPHAGRWYVLPTLNAPFYENGTVYGRLRVTYIGMDSCSACYNVTRHRRLLAESFIRPHEERFLDVSSAGDLVREYNITAVPTIILEGDLGPYPSLRAGWPGTIEEDGAYVLRDLQRLQVIYYDLDKEQVMRP